MPLAFDVADARFHTNVFGKSGSGKTTLLLMTPLKLKPRVA